MRYPRRAPTLLPRLSLASVLAALLSCAGSSSPATPVLPSASTTVGTMTLASPVASNGGTLPAEYTCDGTGATIALTWSGIPPGTRELALMMTTLPGDGTTKWNWVLYGIPAGATGLAKNSAEVGTLGVGSDGPRAAYQPPCSQGPGPKVYTFTLYALSASPSLPAAGGPVTGAILTAAIAPLTLASASFSLTYTRPW